MGKSEEDIPDREEYVVEKILEKSIGEEGVEYFLKWFCWSDEFNSWEPLHHLECPELKEKFETDLKAKEKSTKRKRDQKDSLSSKKKILTKKKVVQKDSIGV